MPALAAAWFAAESAAIMWCAAMIPVLVVTEAQAVADEQAKLDAAVAEKKAADEAESAAKDAYRKSLGDLIDAANSEISGL